MQTLLHHPRITQESWESFTDQDHNTWALLFDRQMKLLESRAAYEVLEGMQKLKICSNQIPKFSVLNKTLQSSTGFSLVAVKGYIPADLFFKFLSQRQLPATCFIRTPEQLDYLEEPDIFHDVFGHVPLLVNPVFADFMQMFGQKGLEAFNLGLLKFADALYWFTVEFGLINTSAGPRIYGAGITSSKTESVYSLESDIPKRIKFDTMPVMKTGYRTDVLQSTYFVTESFAYLFQTVQDINWQKLKHELLA